MRRFILTVMTAILIGLAGNVWAVMVDDPCRVYDYNEMKDMTIQELKVEINLTNDKSLSNLTYGNKMAALRGPVADQEAKQAYKNSNICREQSSRLWTVMTKHPDYVAPPKMTFEQCMEQSKQIHANDGYSLEKQINICNKVVGIK